MLSRAHIGLAGSFGALLVGWFVVVARGLNLTRHLYFMFTTLCHCNFVVFVFKKLQY